MFGEPINLTPVGALVKSIGVIYWLPMLGGFGAGPVETQVMADQAVAG